MTDHEFDTRFPHSVRTQTLARHRIAVERVITAMQRDIGSSMPLDRMAQLAAMSPFHFHRSFTRITGVSPCRFLSGLRIAEAKKLLLTTDISVTDLCFQVGYNSLGTFTSLFTEQVGLSPGYLRRAMRTTTTLDFSLPAAMCGDTEPGERPYARITGSVRAPEDFMGFIFIGLFTSFIPKGCPAACAVLTQSGEYLIDLTDVPAGRYYLNAAAFPLLRAPDGRQLADSPSHVERNKEALSISPTAVHRRVDIALRPIYLTDPPILVSPPMLLLKQMRKL